MENNKNWKVNQDIFNNKEQLDKIALEVVTESVGRDLRNKPSVDQIIYNVIDSLKDAEIKNRGDK